MRPIAPPELASVLRPRAAVVVAHPDDETLWCGGYILTHPEFLWRIVTLCRAADPDRAPRFRRVLQRLGAEGEMADLDDGPDQAPLPVEPSAGDHRPATGWNRLQPDFDPRPEWASTRGIAGMRSAARPSIELWRSGGIDTRRLWLFAYEDGDRAYLPRVRDDADRRDVLTDGRLARKAAG